MEQRDPSFVLIGNDRAVDFVNTRMMIKGACADLLDSSDAVCDWFATIGLRVHGNIDTAEFQAALELRDAITNLFTAFRRNESPPNDAIAIINSHLIMFPSPQSLVFDQNGYRLTEADTDTSGSLSKALAVLAHDAATLVTEIRPTALRACASESCVLIFKDNSKGQRRRWCSMEACGNRAKVATHYRNTIGGNEVHRKTPKLVSDDG